jgi:hypothetical protein
MVSFFLKILKLIFVSFEKNQKIIGVDNVELYYLKNSKFGVLYATKKHLCTLAVFQ